MTLLKILLILGILSFVSADLPIYNITEDNGQSNFFTDFFGGIKELLGMAEEMHTIGEDPPPDGGEKAILSCYCGRNRFGQDEVPEIESADDDDDEDRIVGGRQISNSQDPWMAQILYNGRFICGGTVINDLYVLTAAHCLYSSRGTRPNPRSRYSVRLDTYRRDTGGQVVGISQLKLTSTYYRNRLRGVFNNFVGDLAILRLNRRISLTSGNIRPICLPRFSRTTYNRKYGKITGWGRTADNAGTSYILKQGYSLAIEPYTCRRYTPYKRAVVGEMCGFPVYRSGICFGDSGGPFAINQRGIEYQIGISSHILGRCSLATNRPNIFTDVTVYANAIRGGTRDANYCRG